LGRKTEGNRPLERTRCRWEDIRMALKEIGWQCVDWIHLVQDRIQSRDVVNTEMNPQIS